MIVVLLGLTIGLGISIMAYLKYRQVKRYEKNLEDYRGSEK